MKRLLVTMGVVFGAVLLAVPAFARSLKSSLETTLFGGSQPIFLTVRNPAAGQSADFPDTLVLLSADRNSKIFGRPIQTGGQGGIARIFSRALGSNILTESAVIPLPSGSVGFEYIFNSNLTVREANVINNFAVVLPSLLP